jgi:hypothetical protein
MATSGDDAGRASAPVVPAGRTRALHRKVEEMSFNRHKAVIRCVAVAALTSLSVSGALAQEAQLKPRLKDELRLPWTRGEQSYIRHWLVVGPFAGDLATDYLKAQGGEASVRPQDGMALKRADGSTVKWRVLDAWVDAVGLEEPGEYQDGVVAYAFAEVTRAAAGKALLSVGSDEGIRVWWNGKLVLSRDGLRTTPTRASSGSCATGAMQIRATFASGRPTSATPRPTGPRCGKRRARSTSWSWTPRSWTAT